MNTNTTVPAGRGKEAATASLLGLHNPARNARATALVEISRDSSLRAAPKSGSPPGDSARESAAVVSSVMTVTEMNLARIRRT